jgi:hypothetical protein
MIHKDTLIDFAAGVFGGSAGIIAGHPLDTAKYTLFTHLIFLEYAYRTQWAKKQAYSEP